MDVMETIEKNRSGNMWSKPEKRALLMVNQSAGMGNAKDKIFELITELVKQGFEVVTFPVIPDRGITSEQVISEYRHRKFHIVACIGGDGTLNHVVNALMTVNDRKKAGVPVIYIPSGTTNDYAKTLGLSGDIQKLMQSVQAANVYGLDVGDFGGKFFNYVAAFGAFTNVSYETPQDQKNMLGYLAYLFNGIISAPSSLQTRYHIKVTHEGETEEGDYIFGAVSNATSVAGFKTPALAHASLSDGVFEVMLIKAPEDLQDVGEIFKAAMDGNYDNPYIHVFTAKEVHFDSSQDVSWTLDGEFGGMRKDVKVTVIPKAIKIYKEV
ncbi:diacylglycerol/lipid kinase family protein [Oribacterium sp. WCC10]|uniref:diacylglycerol/lipid kinase family protein n=1 Tax=Oribacterium sp. WCC10 TaxID=1855343 RepID=UPI0008F30D7B|nr:YegS/Rv2252/BmrU family lipid kinase [Oribacterium sp. WCC10]SFG05807.1 lipid kinase, YegS/Rv2252/BmrU family [Oribacterium sp. WCC10]